MKDPAKLLILAGDGIGTEIMREARRVAEWFAARPGANLMLDEALFGIAAWRAEGAVLSDATWAKIEACDAILFGAIGSPDYDLIPPERRQRDSLLRIRGELDLFANLRPIRLIDALADASTLRPEIVRGTDLVIVRELVGGLYFGEPRGISDLPDGRQEAVNTLRYASDEIERIARVAFDLARTRRGRVCSVDKANVMETGALWRRVVQAVHDRDYGDVALSHMYADNCAMQLVRDPRQFDVVVTENTFGDILSDCAAMVAGSIGMLPSASLGPVMPDGRRQALYEPIHGSAPDIAGKGIANPLGAILSFALCLRLTLGRVEDAALLDRAVEAAVAAGARTADLAPAEAGTLSTREMGDRVLAELRRLAE
jgi:3-isopropylmalate dehydrogenase